MLLAVGCCLLAAGLLWAVLLAVVRCWLLAVEDLVGSELLLNICFVLTLARHGWQGNKKARQKARHAEGKACRCLARCLQVAAGWWLLARGSKACRRQGSSRQGMQKARQQARWQMFGKVAVGCWLVSSYAISLLATYCFAVTNGCRVPRSVARREACPPPAAC